MLGTESEGGQITLGVAQEGIWTGASSPIEEDIRWPFATLPKAWKVSFGGVGQVKKVLNGTHAILGY